MGSGQSLLQACLLGPAAPVPPSVGGPVRGSLPALSSPVLMQGKRCQMKRVRILLGYHGNITL